MLHRALAGKYPVSSPFQMIVYNLEILLRVNEVVNQRLLMFFFCERE